MPNGSNIPVTNDNRIEYIYRMADYKLNKQIAKQSQAFKEGLFNVIENRWLRLFDWREVQMLISGTLSPINMEDFKTHTKYSGTSFLTVEIYLIYNSHFTNQENTTGSILRFERFGELLMDSRKMKEGSY